jgi:ATP-binding cassette, subfamily F, member 3
LSGELEAESGMVVKSNPNLKIAFLRQEFIDDLDEESTLETELMKMFARERELLEAINVCEQKLAAGFDEKDIDGMQTVLNDLQTFNEEAMQRDAFNIDYKVDKALSNMGFNVEDKQMLVKSFSGGWKMRIGLAKILCQQP